MFSIPINYNWLACIHHRIDILLVQVSYRLVGWEINGPFQHKKGYRLHVADGPLSSPVACASYF